MPLSRGLTWKCIIAWRPLGGRSISGQRIQVTIDHLDDAPFAYVLIEVQEAHQGEREADAVDEPACGIRIYVCAHDPFALPSVDKLGQEANIGLVVLPQLAGDIRIVGLGQRLELDLHLVGPGTQAFHEDAHHPPQGR